MTKKQRMIGLLTGAGMLLFGSISGWLFYKSKPVAQRTRMSTMIPVVEVTELTRVSVPVSVDCMGTVIADRDVSIQAEVAGRITGTLPGLVEGVFVNAGDVLLTIDRSDYELAVQQAEAALHGAQSALRQEEGRQAVAKHELELIGEGRSMDDAYRDLTLREPQLKAAQADLDAAKTKLERANLDLRRTNIAAPFDAVVQSVDVDPGDYASMNRTLLQLVATDRFFVRASLPLNALSLFPEIENNSYPAEIILTDGTVRSGTLYKLLPDLTAQGRMARILIAVADPFAGARPLLLGEVVRVKLTGQTEENVCLIERTAYRDGSNVWMVDAENKMHILPAEFVQGYEQQVLVRVHFKEGWQLVSSDIPAPVQGMELRIHNAPEGAAE
ncbi:MAG: efflux RND transporter periplasmic adaptor subunit [Kiritimatiellales bacterium]